MSAPRPSRFHSGMELAEPTELKAELAALAERPLSKADARGVGDDSDVGSTMEIFRSEPGSFLVAASDVGGDWLGVPSFSLCDCGTIDGPASSALPEIHPPFSVLLFAHTVL